MRGCVANVPAALSCLLTLRFPGVSFRVFTYRAGCRLDVSHVDLAMPISCVYCSRMAQLSTSVARMVWPTNDGITTWASGCCPCSARE